MHTIYFANESAQNTWFSGRAFRTFQAQSYVRYTRNQIKLQCDVTEILGCPYMRFKNDRAVDKWFYAFINDIEYINENTALITYEIDVMQTWFIQVGSIKPCMVLREHVNDDTFGSNLEEEPVGSDAYDSDFLSSFDEIFYTTTQTGTTYRSNSVVVQTTGDPRPEGETGYSACYKQGMFNGTKYITRRMNEGESATGLAQDLFELLGDWSAGEQKEEIIDMFTVPSNIVTQDDGFDDFNHELSRPTTYDTYTPKNNKLFMYPYSYLLCTTHNGQSGMYRWEYFDGSLIEFRANGTFHGGGQIIAYPRAYNGQENNIDCGIVISDFPKNAFNYDAYQAWIASGGKVKLENEAEVVRLRGNAAKSNELISDINAIGTVAQRTAAAINNPENTSALVGAMTSGLTLPMQLAANRASTKAEIMEAQNKIDYGWKDARYMPNYTVGDSMPALAMAIGFLNYYFYHAHVRDDEAKRIDDFLTVYGYAVNRVKRPNLTGRRYWNFVQTQNCEIGGDMPASSKEAIGRIFDGGITFWHDGSQIGNYQQSVSDGTVNNPIV